MHSVTHQRKPSCVVQHYSFVKSCSLISLIMCEYAFNWKYIFTVILRLITVFLNFSNNINVGDFIFWVLFYNPRLLNYSLFQIKICLFKFLHIKFWNFQINQKKYQSVKNNEIHNLGNILNLWKRKKLEIGKAEFSIFLKVRYRLHIRYIKMKSTIVFYFFSSHEACFGRETALFENINNNKINALSFYIVALIEESFIFM